MKERPILFSGEMVRALLAGRKTQTRRVVDMRRLGFIGDDRDDPALWGFADIHGCWHVLDQSKPAWFGSGVPHESYAIASPYGQPGDRLWVRETWGFDHGVRHDFRPALGRYDLSGMDLLEHVLYAATATDDDERLPPRWRPSIYMPRWASRILLEVTEVRVERLQSISEDDARAEGVRRGDGEWRDEINGKRAPWSSNPWVWVVSFKRVEDDHGR